MVVANQNSNPARQRFLYKPFVPLPNLSEFLSEVIEVRVYAEYLTKFNKAFLKRNFYGQDNYTSDSDVVCILHHLGVFKVTDEQPRDFEAVSVYFRVSKGRNSYPSQLKNGIRSKKLAQFDGHTIKYETHEYLQNLGTPHELRQMSALMPYAVETPDHHKQRKQQLRQRLACLKMPDQAFKAINPALVFNLSQEPAFLFTLSTFAERNVDDNFVSGRLSYKLNDQVLYLETDKSRYEVCKRPDHAHNQQPRYRVSQVLKPLLKDIAYMKHSKLPLSDQEEGVLNVIGQGLEWTDLVWGENTLEVRGV